MPAGKNVLFPELICMMPTPLVRKGIYFFLLTSLRTQVPWWGDYESDLAHRRCLINICGRNEQTII